MIANFPEEKGIQNMYKSSGTKRRSMKRMNESSTARKVSGHTHRSDRYYVPV
jgi:hypothetical protein